MSNQKKRLILLVAVLLITLVAVGCGGKDNPVAEVNGVKISQKDLDRQVDNYVKSIEKQGFGEFLVGEEGKEMVARIREDMLEDMITHQLLAQEASNMGVVLPKERVDEEVTEIKNQLSEQQYKDMLSDYNWTEKDLRQFFTEQLTEQAVFEEVTKEVTVADEDVREYYEQNKESLTVVRSSHILVGSFEEAEALLLELEAGADFAQLAQENSLCPSSSVGGDLDFANKGALVVEYEQVSFALAVGEIYPEPVASDFGYHIIKVTDKKQTLEELRSDIEEILAMEEKSVMFDAYLQNLKETANIVRK